MDTVAARLAGTSNRQLGTRQQRLEIRRRWIERGDTDTQRQRLRVRRILQCERLDMFMQLIGQCLEFRRTVAPRQDGIAKIVQPRGGFIHVQMASQTLFQLAQQALESAVAQSLQKRLTRIQIEQQQSLSFTAWSPGAQQVFQMRHEDIARQEAARILAAVGQREAVLEPARQTQLLFDRTDQCFTARRPGDEAIAAGPERPQLPHRIGLIGQKEDWQGMELIVIANDGRQFDARHLGELHLHQQQIRLEDHQTRQKLHRIADDQGLHADGRQYKRETASLVGMLHQQKDMVAGGLQEPTQRQNATGEPARRDGAGHITGETGAPSGQATDERLLATLLAGGQTDQTRTPVCGFGDPRAQTRESRLVRHQAQVEHDDLGGERQYGLHERLDRLEQDGLDTVRFEQGTQGFGQRGLCAQHIDVTTGSGTGHRRSVT